MFKDEGFKLMGAAFEVYNQLGYGMAEEVYQQSLEIELELRQIPFLTGGVHSPTVGCSTIERSLKSVRRNQTSRPARQRRRLCREHHAVRFDPRSSIKNRRPS